MAKALIGAVLAAASGVWTLVVVKLVQQRRAKLGYARARAEIDAIAGRRATGGVHESPPSPAR